MTGESYKVPLWLILAMWLALPLSWMEYRQHWDQLPARMAVHFDANWQPNGFTSREGALDLGLGILAVMLIVFTVACFTIRALKPQASWPALIVAYVAVGFCWYGNHSIVNFNLRSQAAQTAARAGQFSVRNSRPLRILQPCSG